MKNVFRFLLFVFALTMMLGSLALPLSATDVAPKPEVEESAGNAVKETYTTEDDEIILVFEDGRKYNLTEQEWVAEETEKKGIDLKFDTSNLGTSLTYMWQGMLCIFVVIGVIILSVYLIGFITSKFEERKTTKDTDGNK